MEVSHDLRRVGGGGSSSVGADDLRLASPGLRVPTPGLGPAVLVTAAWLVVGVLGACSDPVAPGAGSTDGGTESTTATSIEASTAAADSTAADETATGEPPPPVACGQGYPIPATEQLPGDPEAGYRALLDEGYVSCGIPFVLFDLAKPYLGPFAEGQPLPGRTGNNALVPYNWTVHTTDAGAEIASLNCLECHAGEFDGELIVGLGKADADYTETIGGGLTEIPVSPIPIPGIEELTRMMERYQAVGDDTRMYTVGTNPADRIAAVLSSHRDGQTLAWLDEPHTPVPDIIVPVDTPPWWHMSKKHGLFWNGMSRGDHRATMIYATSLCTDTIEDAEAILSYFDDIRAYLTTIEPPTYPFEIDATLAAQGEEIFARDCSCCHGTYAPADQDQSDETYPNLLIPVDVIGTDPLIAEQADVQPFAAWFNESWYGQIGPLTTGDPFPGYVAPPLDGIWATAPYLHNASIPTLRLVLDSTARPTHWRRIDYDSRNFDESAVGWPWIEIPGGLDQVPQSEQKHVYDTTRLGHWNTGHPFGDHLTDDERTAVLEYLKTL